MGTSGVGIQLSRTSCLIINIPSCGSSTKVSLWFPAIPLWLGNTTESLLIPQPKTCTGTEETDELEDLCFSIASGTSTRLRLKNVTSLQQQQERKHLRECSREYICIASVGQVQGGWIHHHQTSPPVPTSAFYYPKGPHPSMAFGPCSGATQECSFCHH